MALPTLQRGAAGKPVKRAQALLNVAGARLDEDGDFGSATGNAVEAFQRVSHITSDGVVGPITWSKLLGE